MGEAVKVVVVKIRYRPPITPVRRAILKALGRA
ncbi:hypothetical protein LCGC14_1046070 [marine sediment metagenome]|uniref:Uncharacterized protein n=1 Tax=marine sediment metagenome TaxID=412755 RepID=A0A0F9MQB4_9ZZZZ